MSDETYQDPNTAIENPIKPVGEHWKPRKGYMDITTFEWHLNLGDQRGDKGTVYATPEGVLREHGCAVECGVVEVEVRVVRVVREPVPMNERGNR